MTRRCMKSISMQMLLRWRCAPPPLHFHRGSVKHLIPHPCRFEQNWDTNESGRVVALYVRICGANVAPERSLVKLRPKRVEQAVYRYGKCVRTQFPWLPASAVTVHRVQVRKPSSTIPTDCKCSRSPLHQGSTLESRVHALLNEEIFAAGQVQTCGP